MKDLISRQTAIDGFYEMASDIDHLCTVGEYISFLESLSAQPEIIRCRDCKHFIELLDEESAKKHGQEYACECGRLNKPEPDDFCSRPAPKENR